MQNDWNQCRSVLVTSAVVLITVTGAAVWSRLWILTPIPIGFVFGFFLQKGDLCESSALESLAFRGCNWTADGPRLLQILRARNRI